MPRLEKFTDRGNPSVNLAKGQLPDMEGEEESPPKKLSSASMKGEPWGPPSSADPGPQKGKAFPFTSPKSATGAFTKPGKKRRKLPTSSKTAAGMRPKTPREAREDRKSPLAAGLKAAAEGLAYMPNTGGPASNLLRSLVGGAYAGQSVSDAISQARRTHDRLTTERSKKNTTRKLSDESV
jgi:hypothetical protein